MTALGLVEPTENPDLGELEEPMVGAVHRPQGQKLIK